MKWAARFLERDVVLGESEATEDARVILAFKRFAEVHIMTTA